jgi:type VI secretion system protein ImpC
MAPHVLPDVSREQGSLRAAVDATLTALMRTVLQHPAFQALEAAWRGIDRLVRELELGETLQLQVLDISRAEIEADITATRPTCRPVPCTAC